MITLKPGLRLRSVTCTTEVIVVRSPPTPIGEVRCGGMPMVEQRQAEYDAAAPMPEFSQGTELGKRYAHPEVQLEMLCTKAGAGSLSVDQIALQRMDAKPLPSSD